MDWTGLVWAGGAIFLGSELYGYVMMDWSVGWFHRMRKGVERLGGSDCGVLFGELVVFAVLWCGFG